MSYKMLNVGESRAYNIKYYNFITSFNRRSQSYEVLAALLGGFLKKFQFCR